MPFKNILIIIKKKNKSCSLIKPKNPLKQKKKTLNGRCHAQLVVKSLNMSFKTYYKILKFKKKISK